MYRRRFNWGVNPSVARPPPHQLIANGQGGGWMANQRHLPCVPGDGRPSGRFSRQPASPQLPPSGEPIGRRQALTGPKSNGARGRVARPLFSHAEPHQGGERRLSFFRAWRPAPPEQLPQSQPKAKCAGWCSRGGLWGGGSRSTWGLGRWWPFASYCEGQLPDTDRLGRTRGVGR